ncbi:MAG: flagellar protein FliT, partial [Lachnospiraceae bacterium]
MDTYLQMLKESLDKKIEILNQILQYEEQQQEMVKQENFDYEAFDKSVNEKVVLVDQIEALDDGFEKVYDRIRSDLLLNKDKYA